jgi:hypothetical protein|tara:strand:- start:889 stop:1086 length:198 start_codon:yes stop_codon:yes gene_type:complete
MSEFYWVWAFISAFWTTVVVQCVKPVNWDQCSQTNNWLVPWVRDVTEMHQKGPYHAEKSILEHIE